MSNVPTYGRQGDGAILHKGGGKNVFSVQGTATLAEVNASKVLVAATPGQTIRPIGGRLKFNGAFGAMTALVLQDTAGSVTIISIAQAQAADGAVFDFRNTITGQTIGAGFAAALTAGLGIQIAKTGSSATGGTSVEYIIDYVVE